jgi:ketosteroid isomerase-like protein
MRQSTDPDILNREMSEHDVALVRRAYEEWNTAGLSALEKWAADAIELEDAPQLPDSGAWKGRAAVLGRLAEVAAAIGGTWVDIGDVATAGDEVLVSMVWREDDRAGSPAIGEVFHLVHVTGERIDRLRVFLERDAALAAAGEG